MRTKTITIYKFEELPTESAKENAREWYRQGIDFAWDSESLDSIRAFCAEFGVTLKDWSAGPYRSPEYTTDVDSRHFRGRKLREFKRDHMPTGYCLDSNLWATFYDVFKRTGDAKEAFDQALWDAFRAWRDDMEYQLSDESVDEMLTINEYEFTEDGERA